MCRCGVTPELLCANRISIQAYDYYDRALGERITGPAHKQRVMDERGAIFGADFGNHLDDVKTGPTVSEQMDKELSSKKSEEEFAETYKQVVGHLG